MKPRTTIRPSYPLAAAIATMLAQIASPVAQAAGPYYWDNNGTTAGFGTAAGTWAAPTTGSATQGWSTNSAGTVTPVSVTTATTDALNFGNGTTGLAAGTITVSGTVSAGNITYASGSGAIVLSGGTITLAAADTITVSNSTDTISSVLAGAATSLTKVGTGTLALTATNTYTGNTIVSTGTLKLDFSATGAPATNIINSSSALALGGGTLNLTGKASTTNSQTVTNGTTLNAGASAVVLTANATANPLLLSLGAITRSVGGTVDFTQPTGTIGATNGVTTSTANTAGTILGGWATVGGTGWATNNSTNIVALGSYTTTASAGTTATNYTNNDMDVTNSAGSLSGTITPNSLRFNTAAANTVTLATGTNTINSGGILVTSTVGNNLSTLTGGTLNGASGMDLVVIQNNTSNGLTIASVIADNTTATGLTKAGAGLLTLTSANTYAGVTTIGAGTLQLGGSGTLGSGSYAGNITTNGTLEYSGSAAQTLSGIIGGTGGLTKDTTGTSTLILSGANTYTGATKATAGTLQINGSYTGVGTGTTSLLQVGNSSGTNGTVIIDSGAGTLTFGGDGYTNAAQVGISGGTGALTVNGGTTNIAGANGATTAAAMNIGVMIATAAGTGTVTVNGGTLNVGCRILMGANSASSSGTLTLTGGVVNVGYNGTLGYTGNDPGNILMGAGTATVNLNGGSLKVYGFQSAAGTDVINFNGGTLVALGSPTYFLGNNGGSGATPTAAGTFTTKIKSGGAIIDTNTFTITIPTALVFDPASTGGGLTKNGAGTLVLSNTGNTYTGGTTINSGRIQANALGTIGSGAVTITGNSTVGGQLYMNIAGTISNNFTLSGVGYADSAVNFGAIRSSGNTFSGTITLAGNSRIGMYAGPGATITGQITGPYGMDYFEGNGANNQTGTVTLTNIGTANDYTGNTSISNADYTASTGCKTILKLGAGEQIPNGAGKGNLVFNGANADHQTILELNGFNETLNGVSNVAAAGAVIQNTSSGASVLTLGDGDITSAFSGTITDGGSGKTLALTKTGAGTLTLTGVNTYLGATTVNGGRLQLDGAAAVGTLATGGVTVNSAGTLGFTAGTVTALDLTGKTLTLGGGAVAFDIGASGINDTITVNDFILTGNSAFSLNPVGAVSSGASYTLLTSANPITTNGYTISGQTIGKLSFTPTINTNTVTVTAGLLEGVWNQTGAGVWSVGDPAATGGNWTNYKPSVAGDAVLFGAAITAPATITVDSPQSVGFMRFDNLNTYTIGTTGSSNLTMDNGTSNAVITVTSGSHVIAENVTLASNTSVAPASGTTLTVTGALSGASALQLTDAGTLVLSGANSYTGATIIGAGLLRADNATALGTGGYVTFAGGKLQYTSNSAGTNWATRFKNSTSAIALDTNGQAVTLSGIMDSSNSGGLTKSGDGTLTLSGANTYTGATTINGGTVVLSGGGTISNSSAIAINNGATLTFARSDTWGNAASGASSPLTINSGATVTSGGFFNTMWNLTLNGGTLISNGGVNASFGTFNLAGTVTAAGGVTSTITNGAGVNNVINLGNGTTASNTTFNVGAGGTLNIGTVLQKHWYYTSSNQSVAGGLIKTGAGTLTLSAANTYTGPTTVNAGTLALGASGTLPNTTAVAIGNATLDAATFTNTGGTLAVTGGATINLGTGATLAFADSSAISWTGTLAITGTFVSGVSLRFGTTGGGLTTAQLALISGLGTVSLDANGYLIVPSPYGTWSGGAGFAADSNGDGIANGLAWILGAASPSANGQAVLPTPGTESGFLTLHFMRVHDLGPAKLYLEYSNDLNQSDPWHAVDLVAGPLADIVVVETPGSPNDDVTVKIPTTHASANGKLFARLRAAEN